MSQLSNDEILQVVCPICQSAPLEACKERDGSPLIGGFHRERVAFREAFPVLPKEIMSVLSPTDKAIAVYYAFVLLADSCAANSEKLFGKSFTSQEIQRTFGKAALQKAQADGMLGKASTGNRKQRRAAAKTKKSLLIM